MKTLAGISTGLCLAAGLAAKRQHERQINREAAALWRRLYYSDDSGGVFREELLEGLPEAARRYFRHAIQPGTPIANHLQWRYSGRLRPADNLPWLDLVARQIIVRERGFVWRARAALGPLSVTANDSYLDGEGHMHIALFSTLPLIDASGYDISRSALGRLLIEGAALPTSLLPSAVVSIEEVNDYSFCATFVLHGERIAMTLELDAAGAPQRAHMLRWGNLTDDKSFDWIPYGITMTDLRCFGGYRIPTRIRAGWWYGTDRYSDSIDIRIEAARFW